MVGARRVRRDVLRILSSLLCNYRNRKRTTRLLYRPIEHQNQKPTELRGCDGLQRDSLSLVAMHEIATTTLKLFTKELQTDDAAAMPDEPATMPAATAAADLTPGTNSCGPERKRVSLATKGR